MHVAHVRLESVVYLVLVAHEQLGRVLHEPTMQRRIQARPFRIIGKERVDGIPVLPIEAYLLVIAEMHEQQVADEIGRAQRHTL